jgi:RimJ/RimL family protein N-acetyltransferase
MITGKRVRLRAYREEDLEHVLGWINNGAVTRFLHEMRPRSTYEERDWLERTMRGDDPTSFNLAIDSLEGEYLGGIGLIHIDRRNGSAEVGIVIAKPEHWGQGLGSEAMLLLLRHAFEEMNLHRVQLRVYAYNERGIKSYEKLGFKQEGRLREALIRHGRRHDVLLMGILAEEFFAKHGRTDDGKVGDAADTV